ncbi:hypothetical protein MHBO_001473 [Bonamia ostreae]|uniref:Exportin-5 C-terminal domain-containing protein n=1 Tax=Bonamia ostreae TaxID=126728 RepID=A0ABV2AJ22_9EUKA
MILETFKDAGKKLSTPQITSYFNADNIILLLRPGETEWKTRQIIRVSLNTINALLRGVTKARVSYSNEYRLNYIPVLLVNSFQYDEVWNLAAAAVPFVSALCRALGGLYGDAASKADSDLATILRKPFFVTELLQRTENDSARHMRIRHVSAWINDMRDLCYTMLSLSSNLSDSFFTANPHFITEEVFYNIDKISLGNLKSIGDKLISTLVIRCAASLPQNLDSFLTPILGVFLHQATMRLGNAWQNHSDNLQKRSSQEDLSEEMGLQEELRIFTRGMSKLLYSFSLEISLQRIFERSKPRGIRSDRKEQFRINKILINYLFKSQKVCEPLLTLLSFFLRCPDSIARNNVHRFLLQATRIMCDQREYLETFAKLMVEAIKVQSEIREVDDNLIDFICLLIRLLRKTRRQLPQEVIAAGVPSIPSEDVDFLLNAFASKDTVLHRKKTKQFLLKLSGEEGIELYFERSGMHVNSVRRRTKRGGIAREKTTSFVDPVNLGLLFEGADSL